MKNIWSFKLSYFIATILLFVIEVCIALFVHDKIIRPYIGDFLVVILIYCFLRSFVNFSILSIALATWIFACFVEFLQYLNIVNKIGLQDSKIAVTIIGNSFEWVDILAYTLGIIVVVYVEKQLVRKNTNV
jgi:hypothetical protein